LETARYADCDLRFCSDVSDACALIDQLTQRPRDAFGRRGRGAFGGRFSGRRFCSRRMRCSNVADSMQRGCLAKSQHFALAGPVVGQVGDARQELAIEVCRLSAIENGGGDVRGKVAQAEQGTVVLLRQAHA